MSFLRRVRSIWSTEEPHSRPRDYESVFAETLDELKELDLAGVTFYPKELAAKLADYLGITIEIGSLRVLNHPLVKRKMQELGLVAALVCDPRSNTVWVVIPDGLTGITRRKVILHELAHLIAAHPLEPAYMIDVNEDSSAEEVLSEPWRPLRKLAERTAPEDHDACEEDADMRADALLKASIYGRNAVDRPEYFVGLKDSRFPRPSMPPGFGRSG